MVLPSLLLRNTDQGAQYECQFLRSVSRQQDKRVETCLQVSHDFRQARNTDQGVPRVCSFLWSGSRHGPGSRNMCASFSGVSPVWNRRRLEEGCGSLAQVQASARVDVPTALHFCGTDQGVQHVFTSFLQENAWICARQTTDRDLVSVIPDKTERKKKGEKKIMQICNHCIFSRAYFLD